DIPGIQRDGHRMWFIDLEQAGFIDFINNRSWMVEKLLNLTDFPLSEAPFNFTPPIINQEIFTFANQPHEIVGYLQHHAVVKTI
ncbi:hypothetical protein IAF28_19840, partial [Acinetobacter baumannii]|nr:hypothetical protein [Acinetobacter baumannii]